LGPQLPQPKGEPGTLEAGVAGDQDTAAGEGLGAVVHDATVLASFARRMTSSRARSTLATAAACDHFSATHVLPASPRRRAYSRSCKRRRRAAATAFGSGGTSKPLTPSTTVSRRPPSATATTGRPQALASRAARPRGSSRGAQ